MPWHLEGIALDKDAVKRQARDLPDDLAARLAARVRTGEFAPGARLPSERDLSAEYAVSRPVVREAMSHLKAAGLVEARAGSGVYVTANVEARAFRLHPVDLEQDASLSQVMELLMAIEVAAARSAAIHRTETDLKHIRRELLGMEYAIASDRLGDEEDFAFHQAIVAATHNPYFVSLCSHLEYGARRVIRATRSNTRCHMSEMQDAVQSEHRAIYDAIAASDAEGAARAAGVHLQKAVKRLQKDRDIGA